MGLPAFTHHQPLGYLAVAVLTKHVDGLSVEPHLCLLLAVLGVAKRTSWRTAMTVWRIDA